MTTMSHCCASDKKPQQSPKQVACHRDGNLCAQVPYNTVLHHVKQPWKLTPTEQAYYFCDHSECDVVYFGSDESIIDKIDVRTPVGIKEDSEDALICYCYGVSKGEALKDDLAKRFVIEQTKKGLCACMIRNPSGKCCLKDFPK